MLSTRLMLRMNCSPFCFVIALLYIECLRTDCGVRFTSHNAHTLFLTATVVSTKYLDDQFFFNKHYAHLGGIAPTIFNDMERTLLSLLVYSLPFDVCHFEQFFHRIRDTVYPPLAGSQLSAKTESSDLSIDTKQPSNLEISTPFSSISTLSSLTVHSKVFIPASRRLSEDRERHKLEAQRESFLMAQEDFSAIPPTPPHITAELNRLMLHTISILCPKPYHIHYFGTDLIPAARDAPHNNFLRLPARPSSADERHPAVLLFVSDPSTVACCHSSCRHQRFARVLLPDTTSAIASHACQPDCPRTPTQLILPCGAGEDTGPACSAHLGTAAIEPQQPRAAPLSLLKSTGESVSTPNLTDRHPQLDRTDAADVLRSSSAAPLLTHCTDGASSQPAEQKLPTTITVLGTQPASKPRFTVAWTDTALPNITPHPPALHKTRCRSQSISGLAARAGSTTLGGPPAGRAHPTHKADHSQFTVRSPLPPLAAAGSTRRPEGTTPPDHAVPNTLHTTRPSPCPTPLSSIHRPPNKSRMLSLPRQSTPHSCAPPLKSAIDLVGTKWGGKK
ncbi:hypothetical protein BLNAU_12183 [Blattamonas nauphoetae]|uniref:Uncharacterized protein n=1 Tax=Blattamonas nauphoetae TaxID=2049346 RepID=A0ABQ9XN94_9EUKA|nr:hypothetical protein BLNAU_12183 [Blattamonas nauphoetae]